MDDETSAAETKFVTEFCGLWMFMDDLWMIYGWFMMVHGRSKELCSMVYDGGRSS